MKVMICYLNKGALSLLKYTREHGDYPGLLLGKRLNSFFLPERIWPLPEETFSEAFPLYSLYEENLPLLSPLGFLLEKLPKTLPPYLAGNILLIDNPAETRCFYLKPEKGSPQVQEISLSFGEESYELHH